MRYPRRGVIGLILGLLLIAAVSGCGGGGGGVSLGPAPAGVTGTVVDEMTRQPVEGARVRSGGRSARSAADGTFTLGVEVGTVTVTVSATDYQTGSFVTTTSAGQQVEMGTLVIASNNGPPPAPF